MTHLQAYESHEISPLILLLKTRTKLEIKICANLGSALKVRTPQSLREDNHLFMQGNFLFRFCCVAECNNERLLESTLVEMTTSVKSKRVGQTKKLTGSLIPKLPSTQ